MEYNTENIHLRPNAVVEELLGRLPGLQIDANGNITFNGEKIKQLLVDGEDIFASNPAVITRNLDASKIARVQLLDRKSDQAMFTGIDDGSRTKTLNLVMKENAKDGYFGKVEAGANGDGYYNGNAALAAFRNREQFAALGLGSNIGIVGLASNAGGAAGGAIVMNGTGDPLGASAGAGIPRFTAAALHYANTWNGTGNHLLTNYQYSHYYSEPVTVSQTSQVQPSTIYNQRQRSQSANLQDQHWAYGTYDLVSDVKSAIKVGFYGSASDGQNRFGANANSIFNNTLTNSGQRTIRDQVRQKHISTNFLWRRSIGSRQEQVFSFTAGFTKIHDMTKGYLYSIDRFYQPNGAIQSEDTVDQRKKIDDHSLTLSGSVNYSKPLWKGGVLGVTYGGTIVIDKSLQATFDRGDGKYQEFVDSLSSQVTTQTSRQYAVVNLQGRVKHLNFTLGNSWLRHDYRQRDLSVGSLVQAHYVHWAPLAVLNFTANPNTNFNLSYNGLTQQPTIGQLQPARNNNDPLHVTLGNPNLKPGFSQNLRVDFHRLKNWILNLALVLDLVNNRISTRTITDSLGRQISQPVNVGGGHDLGVYFSINRTIFGLDAGFSVSGSYSRSLNYVNADLNRNEVYTGSAGFNLSKYSPESYSFQMNSGFTYWDQNNSINASAPIRYWAQSHSGSLTLFLIRNFEINTNASYTWQQKTSAFGDNNSVLLWHASIGRNFLSNKLTAKLQLNNILNQNSGITRTNVNNVNTQTSTNILGRYWMLSVIYHFDHKFKRK